MLDAMLIDDESIARQRLRRLLAVHGDLVRIVAEAEDGEEAMVLYRRHAPHVLFLDIEMPGLNGFDVAQRLNPQPLLVFTTAHAAFALDAFRENTVDYLLKPISVKDLERAMSKLRDRAGGLPTRVQGPEELESLEHVLVAQGDTLKPIPIASVVYFEAKDKSTLVHTQGGVFTIDVALSALETRLPTRKFVRTHRRHVVNIGFIVQLKRLGRQLRVILSVPVAEELLVSRRCVDDVLRRLGEVS